MVCGGFACSKNCLCALNLLYTVRGRRGRGAGCSAVPPLLDLHRLAGSAAERRGEGKGGEAAGSLRPVAASS